MPTAAPVSAADMRAIMDPLDEIEAEYRDSQARAGGGVTTSADLSPQLRPLDADVLEGLEEQAFDNGDVLPLQRLGVMPDAMTAKFLTPNEGDGELATEFPNQLGPQSNHDKRLVYDCQGRATAVQYAKLRHYLTKPCAESHHNHRAFYATLAQAQAMAGAPMPIAATIPCLLAPRCGKLFDSVAKRDAHFRNRHPASFQQRESERIISAAEATAQTQAGILEVLGRLVPQNGGTGGSGGEGVTVAVAPVGPPATPNAKPQKAAPTLAPMPEGDPVAGWKVYQIKQWLEERGHPLPANTFGMKVEAWLAHAGQFVG